MKWTGLAMVIVAGCSGGPSLPVSSATTFCASYVDTLINRLQDCQGGSAAALETSFQTSSPCDGIDVDVAAGRVSFAAGAASACLGEIKALDCGSLAASRGVPSDCARVFQGTVPVGGDCFPIALPGAQECVAGSHCVADSHCPGVCQPDGTLGESCDPSIGHCAAGLTCNYTDIGQAICVAAPPEVSVGSPCAGSDDCESAGALLVCEGPAGPIDGVSSAPPAGSGTCQKPAAHGPCNTKDECSTNNCVAAVPGTTTGVCMPGKVVGDTCIPGAGQCGRGTYCGAAGKCVELPVVGQSCAGNAGEGTACINGYCSPLTNTCAAFLTTGTACHGQANLGQLCNPADTCSQSWGICLPACAPGGKCGGPGQICCANEICASGFTCSLGACAPAAAGVDAGRTPPPPPNPDAGAGKSSGGIPLVPNAQGAFDGTNAAGVMGAWWAAGDDYDGIGRAGAGNCPQAGFPDSECSVIDWPKPGQPFVPDPNGRGMCTSGTVARVLNSDAGQPDYSAIWGNIIGFNLNQALALAADGGASTSDGVLDGDVSPAGYYDAPAHGITGIAFDLDTPPPAESFRVGFPTLNSNVDAPYWGGATANYSPIAGTGHYEIRWPQVGGPHYLTFPPPFDPSKLQRVEFEIITSQFSPVSYNFCVNNLVMLTE